MPLCLPKIQKFLEIRSKVIASYHILALVSNHTKTQDTSFFDILNTQIHFPATMTFSIIFSGAEEARTMPTGRELALVILWSNSMAMSRFQTVWKMKPRFSFGPFSTGSALCIWSEADRDISLTRPNDKPITCC